MIDHSKNKNAYRTVLETEGIINAAKQKYEDQLKQIDSQKEYTAPSYMEKLKAEAKANYEAVASRSMKQFAEAVSTIKQSNNYSSEAADFGNADFQNALRFIDSMGKDLSYTDQVNIIDKFRGNPAELKAIETKYRNNGLYFSEEAKDSTTPLSATAIENAELVIAGYEYNGKPDFSKMLWNRQDFRNQAKRLGYDLETADDPYTQALISEKKRLPEVNADTSPEEKARIDFAKYHINEALNKIKAVGETGEGSIEDIFSNTINTLEHYAVGSEVKE